MRWGKGPFHPPTSKKKHARGVDTEQLIAELVEYEREHYPTTFVALWRPR